jgi:hypothetical protein
MRASECNVQHWLQSHHTVSLKGAGAHVHESASVLFDLSLDGTVNSWYCHPSGLTRRVEHGVYHCLQSAHPRLAAVWLHKAGHGWVGVSWTADTYQHVALTEKGLPRGGPREVEIPILRALELRMGHQSRAALYHSFWQRDLVMVVPHVRDEERDVRREPFGAAGEAMFLHERMEATQLGPD